MLSNFFTNQKKTLLTAIVCVAIFLALACWLLQIFSSTILTGVQVSGIELSGLTPQQAEEKLHAKLNTTFRNPVITLALTDNNYPLTAEQLGLSVDINTLAQTAYSVGRDESWLQSIGQRLSLIYSSNNLPLQYAISETQLHSLLIEMADKYNVQPTNATISINDNGTLNISRDKAGRQLQIDAAQQTVSKLIRKKIYQTIELSSSQQKATITYNDLTGIDSVLAKFSTRYSPYDQNRSTNVELAASRISHALIKPDEVFSYDQAVGSRNGSNGWQKAMVYVNGIKEIDWGGGVCQVSSTLYNAVLLADLEIVERTSHSHPPAYVPVGLDATIAEGFIDFKFRNNSGSNVYLLSYAGGGYLSIYILGHKRADFPEIEILRTNYSEKPYNSKRQFDSSIPAGSEKEKITGYPEYNITTWRVRYLNGKEISRELLANDNYPATDELILYGPPVDNSQTAIKKPS